MNRSHLLGAVRLAVMLAIACTLPRQAAGGDTTVPITGIGTSLAGDFVIPPARVELMYQTRDAMKADLPAFADAPSVGLYFLEVDDLDAVIALLGETPLAVPRRKTFYGTDEIAVRDPVGNAFVFAQPQSA